MHTQTHTHTHTHTRTHTLTEIKYTSNCDNVGLRNLKHGNSCFLMKTSDLRKLLGKLREIN